MKIFVAGAAGAIGRLLLPQLVQAGHEVTGMTRNPDRMDLIRKMGATPLAADALDREAMLSIIREAQPDVVMHQLTSLGSMNFADNSRIRIEGTRNLVDAAREAGVKKMIAQSISFAYAPGDTPATEEDPLDTEAPMPRKQTVEGVIALETAVAEMPEYVILRYGSFYGPGTWYGKYGSMAEKAMHGEIAATDGITSFLHVEDAARAAVLALDWHSGTVNIVDDEPARGTDWVPAYVSALGGPEPKIQPGRNPWERGASNAKARREYGWEPLYPTWRTGFSRSLS